MAGRAEKIKRHQFKPEAASTADEARRHREISAKGGVASGEARRRRISMRDELLSLLEVGDGTIAKAITVAICREAKAGSVPAYRAILETLGELQNPNAVQVNAPPVVIGIHDSSFVEAERIRQADQLRELREAGADADE